MSLTPEWQSRIMVWKDELRKLFYMKLGAVDLSGSETYDRISADEALKREFKPMPSGTRWGAKWEYCWYKGKIILPDKAAGRTIVLNVDVGGDCVIYINGEIAGAKDKNHSEITLMAEGIPGKSFDILIEAYSGHGPIVCGSGPIEFKRISMSDTRPTRAVVRETSFGIWLEDVFQLWLDVETLIHLRDNIDPESLRVSEIDAGLRDFATIVDFELPYDELFETINKCREWLKPLFECINGSTSPTLYAFGNSHIDVAWFWPLTESERICCRTFSTQLALIDEYPEYKFFQCQPYLYQIMKTCYPDLYERVKKAVENGRIIPEGGMWVEGETHITGGESLIRQFIHGKRFFRNEFGVNSEFLWLPDVFGFSGALPQILRGCGIKYFSTAKMFMPISGENPFPYNSFVWEGIDGSQVLSHLCTYYCSETSPKELIERWKERVQKDGIKSWLLPFGWANDGGGPTRKHLEFLKRVKDLEGVPRTKIASPVEFFHNLESKEHPDAKYTGELYCQAHRGTYTSQAETKKNNRKSEFALRDAEMWGTVASWLKGYDYPRDIMDKMWEKVLLNQFHDIILGSSIHRVHDEANTEYEVVTDAARKVAGQAASLFTVESGMLSVFNSLSWPRRILVTLPEAYKGAAGIDGRALGTQELEGRTIAEADVPACGWTTICPSAGYNFETMLQVSEKFLENEFLHMQFNNAGEITSILDKTTGRQITAGVCNSFRMYKDLPTSYDAWDIDSFYHMSPIELDKKAEVKVIAAGPLIAGVRILRNLNKSYMTQEITLRHNSRRVEFKTTIDWKETHKLLKVNFPVDIHTNEGINEIQFGHIHRPNHKSRQFDADRFEVTNHKWSALTEENRGFAILNDCKYGLSMDGGSINLTLLKSATAPDVTAENGIHEFTYAFYVWNGPFADSGVINEAYDLNCPIIQIQGDAGECSVFSVNAGNVIIETVKPAEDGTKDIIIRLYEAKRMATSCILSTVLKASKVVLTDMLENEISNIPFENGLIRLDFRPFEIKTVRMVF